MQEEMEKRGIELTDAMATIERLQRQLEETQVIKTLQNFLQCLLQLDASCIVQFKREKTKSLNTYFWIVDAKLVWMINFFNLMEINIKVLEFGKQVSGE